MIKRVLPVNHFGLDLIFFHLLFGFFIDLLSSLFTFGLNEVLSRSNGVTQSAP